MSGRQVSRYRTCLIDYTIVKAQQNFKKRRTRIHSYINPSFISPAAATKSRRSVAACACAVASCFL